MARDMNRHGWIIAAALGLVVMSSGCISAENPAAGSTKPQPRRFFSVLDLKQQGTGTVLIGGREAKSTDFPASLYAVSDKGYCTSALVSATVMLTAAHCVTNGENITVTLNKKSYDGVCTRAPGYVFKPYNPFDWALCLMSSEIPGIAYELVNTDASRIQEGGELLLAGYGCVTTEKKGGHDGKYRIGEASVDQVPTGDNDDIRVKGVPTPQGKATLCPGDSGGPAFLYLDVNKRYRVIAAVNSRFVFPDTSYLSSTSTKRAKDFFDAWSKTNGARICGIHSNAVGCRKPQ